MRLFFVIMKKLQLPETGYAPYYTTYLNQLPDDCDLIANLEISLHEFIHFVREIPLGKHEYRYAEGKWTIKDIIQHLIDAERIFSYRALRIARNDKTPLPGFEENDYAAIARSNERNLQSLLEEFSIVRHSTLLLFKTFTDEEMMREGIASNNSVTAAAIGFIIIGHMKHHQMIFEERYL